VLESGPAGDGKRRACSAAFFAKFRPLMSPLSSLRVVGGGLRRRGRPGVCASSLCNGPQSPHIDTGAGSRLGGEAEILPAHPAV